MTTIKPINKRQQDSVITTAQSYIRQAEDIFARPFTLPTIVFDLQGRATGMYMLRQGQHLIRFNPYTFTKYFDDIVRCLDL